MTARRRCRRECDHETDIPLARVAVDAWTRNMSASQCCKIVTQTYKCLYNLITIFTADRNPGRCAFAHNNQQFMNNSTCCSSGILTIVPSNCHNHNIVCDLSGLGLRLPYLPADSQT